MADEPIVIDLDSLTLSDLMELERELGRKTGDMLSRGIAGVDAQTLAGLIWLNRHKADPSYTLADALNTKFSLIKEAPKAPLAEPSA